MSFVTMDNLEASSATTVPDLTPTEVATGTGSSGPRNSRNEAGESTAVMTAFLSAVRQMVRDELQRHCPSSFVTPTEALAVASTPTPSTVSATNVPPESRIGKPAAV